MTTEAGLKTVHMFPSVDSYLNHKNEVAEGDLPLIPLHKVAYTGKMEDLEGGIVVTETWKSKDGLSWYRKWSDGWVEQGGILQESGSASPYNYPKYSVTLPLKFSNTDFYAGGNSTGGGYQFASVVEKTEVSIAIGVSATGGHYYEFTGISWYACGY